MARLQLLALPAVAALAAMAGCASPAGDLVGENAESAATPVFPFVYANETTIRWVKAMNFGYVAGGVLPDFTFDVPANATRLEATIEWTSTVESVATLTSFLATQGESFAHARGASPLLLVVDDPAVVPDGGRWQIGAWPGDDPVTVNPEETTLTFTVTVI